MADPAKSRTCRCATAPTPLLGPVLALTAHGRRLPVPVGAATDALAPAAGRLLGMLSLEQLPAAETRLQELTVSRLAQCSLGLLGGT
ncbi:hypothetical protein [Streptomyces sp. NPDC047000]|uniref:hypothetical protein n=1 Tax=Streptomyces sp. NPDC047000 TaxID=3155474 RepID=UPI0033E50672